MVGTVEDWVYVNMTGDTHPMHVHLVTFQVVGRTPFDVEAYQEAYGGPTGCPAASTPRRSRPGRWCRQRPRSGASRTPSRRTPATSRRSGRSSTCRGCHGAAELCAPLPHRRARGQRHDAAVHRHGLRRDHPGRALLYLAVRPRSWAWCRIVGRNTPSPGPEVLLTRDMRSRGQGHEALPPLPRPARSLGAAKGSDAGPPGPGRYKEAPEMRRRTFDALATTAGFVIAASCWSPEGCCSGDIIS